ncbi:MAG TPA: 6-carboxytetrahydropterin synthase QueD [Candidatus Cloacimonas sp.]|jgi:6-pyruvoyltetrahydropterin/6-carboxytetrahydropterin synthase|nr:6-pyruvoyltetrahydropterin/6-carboxytetrahydropterin synthase [Candidatus Cloacimonadota bacterium]HCX72915.1 6-carboxytetrahydropterin synthase QueD [Candidatus Cloacimonas sp.]
MYKLNVTSHFSAAHKLVGYNGPCRNIHGHNWKVRIGILCKNSDEIGLTIDFGIVKAELAKIMNKLDHTMLNELEYFNKTNPTSENISKFIYKEISKTLNNDNCCVADVEVWESEKSSITYFENA